MQPLEVTASAVNEIFPAIETWETGNRWLEQERERGPRAKVCEEQEVVKRPEGRGHVMSLRTGSGRGGGSGGGVGGALTRASSACTTRWRRPPAAPAAAAGTRARPRRRRLQGGKGGGSDAVRVALWRRRAIGPSVPAGRRNLLPLEEDESTVASAISHL